jgi:hypothetical protein
MYYKLTKKIRFFWFNTSFLHFLFVSLWSGLTKYNPRVFEAFFAFLLHVYVSAYLHFITSVFSNMKLERMCVWKTQNIMTHSKAYNTVLIH